MRQRLTDSFFVCRTVDRSIGLMVSYIFSRALIEKNLTNPKKGVIYAKPDGMELLDSGCLHFYCREFELYSRLARVSEGEQRERWVVVLPSGLQ